KAMNGGGLETVLTATHKYNASMLVKSTLEEFGTKYNIEYEYDDNGVLVKKIEEPSSKDEKTTTTTYKYEKGKVVEEQEFEGKSKSAANSTKYEYNDLGEVVKLSHYRDGEIHSEIDYVYLK
ncbi:MAG: hypothetical protein MK078_09560, partial [Crocinitomicaceae bacterium]|nr:hypothetical protein [Crocinitomicaceae bacterium]